MKGARFGIWMAGMNIGLVLLVAAGLLPGGLLLLRRLAADGASARVELAALAAVEALRVDSEEVWTGARLLAERPTLQRLIAEDRAAELSSFLAQFRGTSQLDGCAVWSEGEIVAAEPADAPWGAIRSGPVGGLRYLEGSEVDAPVLVAAVVPLSGGLDGAAATYRRLDRDLARKLEDQAGLPVRIYFGKASGAGHPVRDAGGGWHARRVLAEVDRGHEVGVEVELPAHLASAALGPIEQNFMVVTALAVLIAIGAAFLSARHLSRPITKLQASARRIGAGDLSTPVPAIGGFETGALARTMESMRVRIQRATAELHQREAEARALLEGMFEGVFAVDGERRIEYLNPQAARLLGADIDQIVGKFCGDVLHPDDPSGVRPCETSCPIVQARSRGSSRFVEHLDLPAGRRTMVVTSAPPAGGRQVQLLRDETDSEAARRSRDSVLANVSHELKTPLSAQMVSIQLLQDALDGTVTPQAAELVDSLERSTLRLSRLIDNLLESVRIETGRASTRFAPVDLRAIAADAEATTAPLLRQKRQELLVELPTDLAPVRGDPTQLVQVIVNLLSNANKFSPEGSVVRIGGSSDASSVAVWVEDSGPGIPDRERGAVFDYYYRADPSAAEGMGLGLWIVKSIVERHGGTIAATPAESGGARLTIRLPQGTSR
jgi:signal transduction histidine kinase/HAMP domain-containing protein